MALPILTPTNEWFLSLAAAGPVRLRLFCFLNAGGSPTMLRPWPLALPIGVEVCAVQFPGQGSRFRELPYNRLQPLVSALADALLPHLGQPFAFCGYSMGALAAFELARELRRRGGPMPGHLFVVARRAPHKPPSDSPLHPLSDTEFIRVMQHRYNGIPKAILNEPDMLKLFLPILRAQFEMIETYSYQPEALLECHITAFGGLQDPTVSASEIAGWGEQTSGGFKHFMFPGDHFFLQLHQNAVLDILSRDLMQMLA